MNINKEEQKKYFFNKCRSMYTAFNICFILQLIYTIGSIFDGIHDSIKIVPNSTVLVYMIFSFIKSIGTTYFFYKIKCVLFRITDKKNTYELPLSSTLNQVSKIMCFLAIIPFLFILIILWLDSSYVINYLELITYSIDILLVAGLIKCVSLAYQYKFE